MLIQLLWVLFSFFHCDILIAALSCHSDSFIDSPSYLYLEVSSKEATKGKTFFFLSLFLYLNRSYFLMVDQLCNHHYVPLYMLS